MRNKAIIPKTENDKYSGFREIFDQRKSIPPYLKRGIIAKNKDRIIEWYTRSDNPLSAEQIGDRLNVAGCTIQLALKRWGIKSRDYHKAKPKEVLRYYNMGWTPEEIAETLDTDSGTIYKVLKNILGIRYTKKIKLTSKQWSDLHYYLRRGMSHTLISELLNEKYNTKKFTPNIVLGRMREKGLKKMKVNDVNNEELIRIIQLSKKGHTPKEIAKKVVVPWVLVSRIINNYSMPKNRGWKQLQNEGEIVDKIRDLRQKGYLYSQISHMLSIGQSLLSDLVAKHKLQGLGRKKRYTQEEINKYAKRIREMREGPGPALTINQISQRLNIPTTAVQRIIKQFNIPHAGRLFTDELRQKVKQMFLDGKHYNEIAKKLDLKQESVRQELHRMGISKRNTPWDKTYDAATIKKQNEYIKKHYLQPHYYSIFQIAKDLGLDKTTVKDRLQKMGVRIRSAAEQREIKKMKRLGYNG